MRLPRRDRRNPACLRKRSRCRDGFAAGGFADEFHLVTLDILDTENPEFVEKVEGEIVDGIAEDALLDEEDVAFCLFDLLDHVEEVGALFLEDLVHLTVVVDDDLVLHVGFGWGELELDEGDLDLFYSGGTAGALAALLAEDQTLEHFGIVNDASRLLQDANVAKINVLGVCGVDRAQDGINSHGRSFGS